MKKLSIALAVVVLFSAHAVSAQSTYFNNSMSVPSAFYGTTSGMNCVSISRDLNIGSRGSDVSKLQSFLANRNYPGGGSWMVTGYFGAATRAGVINFQIDSRLPQTGWVDAATRMALQNGCGSTVPFGNNTFTGPTPNWNNSYQYPSNYPSTNPNNSYSNPFPISQPWYTNPTYPNNNYVNPCSGNPSYYSCTNSGSLNLTYLSPNSGGVGTLITVFGTGFSTTGNSVRFGNGIIAGLNSTDGRTVSFTVPTTLSGYGSQNVYLGSYNVSVTNNNGQTSNALPFTVTSLGNSGAPSIVGISGPNTIAVNTSGTWSISLNNQYNSNTTSVSVNWGDTVYGAYTSQPQQVYAGQQNLTFSHSYAQTGTYTIVVTATNGAGQSNTASATVVVSGNPSGTMTLSYLSPSAGQVGTQVQIVGNGFSAFENTVHFGNGGTMHVPSQNGTVIYYTIPRYISPCDVLTNGTVCAQYLQQVSNGSYQIYVSNGSNTTNPATFTVQ